MIGNNTELERLDRFDRFERVDLDALKSQMMAWGADDVGFVSLERPELAKERAKILAAFPETKTLISFVVRMNRGPTRSPARSVSNLEFHHTGEAVDAVARRAVRFFEDQGISAMNPSMGFPMEVQHFGQGDPSRLWVVSHKIVAEAAGLGKMGIHRNVIHPRFGNFILLGTILVGAEIVEESQPIDFNPCLSCKLCVAACPVGAIGSEGSFNAASCFNHNYREFMGGFNDWVDTVAESKSKKAYHAEVSTAETASLWQSLSFGANYKAAYCLAVCPAGEEVLQPFLEDRPAFINSYLKPLREKVEPVYVVKGSDAADYAKKRYPHKPLRYIGSGLTPQTIDAFLSGMFIAFQPGQAKDLSATYHFSFTGAEPAQATVRIHEQRIAVTLGHEGRADLHVTADSRTWLRFLAKEYPLALGLLSLKIKLAGSPRWLVAFGKCFP
jgi:Fe-S-cluster-containing hydrogenase component 2